MNIPLLPRGYSVPDGRILTLTRCFNAQSRTEVLLCSLLRGAADSQKRFMQQLLFELFREHLISSGVKQENIITLALDSIENEKYTDPYILFDYLKSRIADKTEEYYILLDEIQYAISSAELRDKDKPPRLYGVLNGLIGMKNADVYITGSNSRLGDADDFLDLSYEPILIVLHPEFKRTKST